MSKPIHERAMQFAPYAALRGFDELIDKRRERKEKRKELAEDERERINRILSRLSVGSLVRVKYYEVDRYKTLCGVLSELDTVFYTLTVVKTKIDIADIDDIEPLSESQSRFD